MFFKFKKSISKIEFKKITILKEKSSFSCVGLSGCPFFNAGNFDFDRNLDTVVNLRCIFSGSKVGGDPALINAIFPTFCNARRQLVSIGVEVESGR